MAQKKTNKKTSKKVVTKKKKTTSKKTIKKTLSKNKTSVSKKKSKKAIKNSKSIEELNLKSLQPEIVNDEERYKEDSDNLNDVLTSPIDADEILDPKDFSENQIDESVEKFSEEEIQETIKKFKNLEAKHAALVPKSSTDLVSIDPVTRYMNEVSKYPMLSREQEVEVAQKYFSTKDPRLAEVLVTANLRFVVKVAAEYSKFGARLIDLIQEGNVGLMHAVREFNPYKGVKLITYAVWWIRGYIQEYLMRQYSLVRIGTTQNQRKLFYQLQRERAELERLGEEEGIKQISGRLGISEAEVAEMHKRISSRDLSLSQPMGDDDTTRLMDLQTGDQGTELDEMIELKDQLSALSKSIDNLRPHLNEKEAHILENRLLSDSPLTLQEIGDQWGVTREAVRQMEVRVMNKLKKTLTPD